MRIVNLTPHDIVLKTDAGEMTFPPSGIVARVSVTATEAPPVRTSSQIAIPCIRQECGEVTGLPPERVATFFLVSRKVYEAEWLRNDLLAPDTEDCVRDEKGQVLSVRRFIRR